MRSGLGARDACLDGIHGGTHGELYSHLGFPLPRRLELAGFNVMSKHRIRAGPSGAEKRRERSRKMSSHIIE